MRHNRRQIAFLILIQQHRAPGSAVFGHGVIHFVNDHAVKRLIGSKNAFKLFDTPLQVVAFRLKLDTTHLGQTAQPQVKNVLCLNLIQIEYGDKLCFRASASSEERIT